MINLEKLYIKDIPINSRWNMWALFASLKNQNKIIRVASLEYTTAENPLCKVLSTRETQLKHITDLRDLLQVNNIETYEQWLKLPESIRNEFIQVFGEKGPRLR